MWPAPPSAPIDRIHRVTEFHVLNEVWSFEFSFFFRRRNETETDPHDLHVNVKHDNVKENVI